MESAQQKKREILARLGDDQELLLEIIQVYFEDAPDLLAQIRLSIDRADAKQLASAAHRLKGLLANFSMPELNSQIQLVEQCGRRSDFGIADSQFTGLQSQLKFLDLTLKNWQGG